MVLGQTLTGLVVPAFQPVVVLPTRLEEATDLDLITEAIDVRGAQSNDVGDDLWNDFEERIALGGGRTSPWFL
jgi:hypothetical protein